MYGINPDRAAAAIVRLNPDTANWEDDLMEAAWTLIPDEHLRNARVVRDAEDGGIDRALEQLVGLGILTADRIITTLERSADQGIKLLTRGHWAYPTQLDDLGNTRPEALWMLGSYEAVATLDKGVVLTGARGSTGYGELLCSQLASELVQHGRTVVSGGSYGIGGTANRATMAAGGVTVAVLAGGLDRFYPAGHDELLRRVAESGAILTEVPIGGPPTRWRFLARNRLVSALAAATVVVEAGSRSGSLETARVGFELGRIVGAVPGPITSGVSAGTHQLIKDGALLVQRAQDVIDAIDGKL